MVEDVMDQEHWRNVYPISVPEEVMAMPHDTQELPTPLDDRANLPIWIPLVIPEQNSQLWNPAVPSVKILPAI